MSPHLTSTHLKPTPEIITNSNARFNWVGFRLAFSCDDNSGRRKSVTPVCIDQRVGRLRPHFRRMCLNPSIYPSDDDDDGRGRGPCGTLAAFIQLSLNRDKVAGSSTRRRRAHLSPSGCWTRIPDQKETEDDGPTTGPPNDKDQRTTQGVAD
ncbi:hypothetical protein TcasGA2_TC006791 [Tribolium castaneum]|uniref:Uncharacterized protein n=1 Tax=Tribolium castaneum TaxID=7070 RepID=D6WUW7_TRICA|nr:hypothetical protein TcasGA2_TC006791 [Tribolium castaneum]